MSLVSKDEMLSTSMVYIGYLVLKELDSATDRRVSLTFIMSHLKKKKINQYRPIMFALIFLHVIGAIEFSAPYIYKV
jgi:hypothetical protein